MPQYWVTGTQYNPLSTVPGYTFTRSGEQGAVDSGGTVAFFAANTPAINSAGYHAYGALTNEIVRSQEFNNASWAKSNTNATADFEAAPDGTTTADKIALITGNTFGYASQVVVKAASSQTRTFSCFCKAAGVSLVTLRVQDSGSNGVYVAFNLSTGVVGTKVQLGTGFDATGYIVALANGWYRCTIVITTNADTSLSCQLWPYDVAAGPAYTIDSIIGVSLWQAQALLGNFPDGGPLITTTTAAASIGASLLYNNIKPDGSALAAADMLLFARITPAAASPGLTPHIIEMSDGTANNRATIYLSGDAATAYVVSGGVPIYTNGAAGALVVGQEATVVLRRLGGDWRIGKIVGGVLTWASTGTAAFPAGMTKITHGNTYGGSQTYQGRIAGDFLKLGTFSTDAQVLAAVAETA